MKVLVTGAAGFIGSKIMYLLAQRGEEVVGIDNLNTYYDPRMKFGRLVRCGFVPSRANEAVPSRADDAAFPEGMLSSNHFPDCRFIKMDICDKPALDRLFAEEKFDAVLHFAAQAGVRYSIDHPYDFLNSNIYGFLNILEACRHQTVRHLVYASSSSVYGLNTKSPNAETDQVDTPVSLYGATKKSAELMAHSYAKLYGLPVTGLRFFSVYGPWGRPDMSPMLFAEAIRKGKPIKVFNHGDMSRDFTYIDDVAEAVLRILDHIPGSTASPAAVASALSTASPTAVAPALSTASPAAAVPALSTASPAAAAPALSTASPAVPYRIYNVGCSHPVPLMDFISELENALGQKAEKIFLPMQAGDVYQTYADTTRLENEIGFKPAVSLHEGIRRFVDWYLSPENPLR